MKCLICNESSEKSLCDDCSIKKRCKECNIMKNCNTFYSYKNGKMYSTCIECFNIKVRCEFCHKELNKSYLRSHVKKQHYNQDDKRAASHNDEAQEHSQLHTINNIGGDLLPAQLPTQLPNKLNNDDNNKCNRTLLVGPSFCATTHLLLNKLQLILLSNSEKQIKIISRSP